MATKYPLTSISKIVGRRVFFDANVLIYIFWPSGAYDKEKSYSAAFGELLRQKNELVVDFIVLSEIVNRIHRLEYDKYLASNRLSRDTFVYKKYRDSTEGQASLADIYLMLDVNILSIFKVVGKAFSKADIQSLLTTDSLDFADKGILMTCQENACILITNDADYKAADVEILSSNLKILSHP
jgi:predicted nucleic acid-binding protein